MVVVRHTPRRAPSQRKAPANAERFWHWDVVPRRPKKKLDAFVQGGEVCNLACGACDWPRDGSRARRGIGGQGLSPWFD